MNLKERLQNKSLQEQGVSNPLVKMRVMMKEMLQEVFASFKLEVKAEIQKEVKNIVPDILGEVGMAAIKKELAPKKGTDYNDGKDGKNADEAIVVKKVLEQITRPKDGKDADANKIIEAVVKRIPVSKIDTNEQIVEKVNKAKGVQIESVTNLKEEIANLKKRVAYESVRKGGGMGNVITQSTTISSSTTTITLENNVASNGKAIWFNYQGQQQAYGTHFTVSGKIITLLFTPSDDTYADIIYIRK